MPAPRADGGSQTVSEPSSAMRPPQKSSPSYIESPNPGPASPHTTSRVRWFMKPGHVAG